MQNYRGFEGVASHGMNPYNDGMFGIQIPRGSERQGKMRTTITYDLRIIEQDGAPVNCFTYSSAEEAFAAAQDLNGSGHTVVIERWDMAGSKDDRYVLFLALGNDEWLRAGGWLPSF